MWITSHSWQALSYKNKRQSMLAHKYKITSYLIFLSSSNFRSIKFKPLWLFEFTSHLWQQALSYKKERPELFLHNMELRTYLNFTGVVVTFLALTLRHSDYQWLLTTNKRHSVYPKTAKFWNYVLKRDFKAIVTVGFLGMTPVYSETTALNKPYLT